MAKIEEVRLWRYVPPPAASDGAMDWLNELSVTGPLADFGYDKADNISPGRPAWAGPTYVEIRTDDGLHGLGTARHGAATAQIFASVLTPALLGRDASDINSLWDLMLRRIAEYGAAGHALAAVSGADCALWDLAGKRAGLPVRRLLDPEATAKVSLYATGPNVKPFRGQGFRGVKVWLMKGDAASTTAWLRKQQHELDEGQFLAVDCYMGLEPERLLELHKATEDLGIAFWEEPLRPWQVEELAELRRAGVPIASGEHNSHFECERLIRAGAVDVIQPELTWTGGFTSALRLARLAADEGVRFIPHAGGIIAFQLVAGLGGPDALAEFSFYHCAFPGQAVPSSPIFRGADAGRMPVDGSVTLPESAGFGIELREDAAMSAIDRQEAT